MKKLQLICVTAAVLFSMVSSFAQQTDAQKSTCKCNTLNVTALPLNGAFQINVPEGEGTWTVQISTGGGILGGTKDYFELTSTGNLTRNQNSLTKSETLTSETLNALAQLIAKVRIPKQDKPLINHTSNDASVCSDCYYTTFVLSRREAKGKIKTLTVSWDVTTKAQVAEEILRIYESIENLVAAK